MRVEEERNLELAQPEECCDSAAWDVKVIVVTGRAAEFFDSAYALMEIADDEKNEEIAAIIDNACGELFAAGIDCVRREEAFMHFCRTGKYPV